MISFLFGILIGLSIGYPLGLWAIGYGKEDKDGR